MITSFHPDGVWLSILGLVFGSLAALAVGQLLASRLDDLRGRDHGVLSATALALVALVAACIPAPRNACRSDHRASRRLRIQ